MKLTQRTFLQFLPTKDGSFSLYSEKYNDFYHSTKDGAILETLYKHIIPTFYLNNKKHLKILDICFGLGYNALFSLAFAKKLNKSIEIYSVELHLLENLRHFCYPVFLKNYLPLDEILESIFSVGFWQSENLFISLHKGDAKLYLESLLKQFLSFDIIYQDAFSPSKNVELWSEAHFQNLFLLLNQNGVISTYSSNKKVRETCQNIGFEVYNMQCGNLKQGSIFCKTQPKGKIQLNSKTQLKSLSFEGITLTHLPKRQSLL